MCLLKNCGPVIVPNGDMFLFVVSPDKQKTNSLRPLWFDRFDRLTALRLSKGRAHHPEFIEGRLCGEKSLSA